MAARRKPTKGVIAKAKRQVRSAPAKKVTPMAKASAWAKASGRKKSTKSPMDVMTSYLKKGYREYKRDINNIGNLNKNLADKKKKIDELTKILEEQ